MNEPKLWQPADGIYAIQCPGYFPGPGRLPGWGRVICYLVVGGEKALLIDTGYGNFDLLACVRQITCLPLMVLNTHLHPDHSGGNPQFDTVWIGEWESDTEEGLIYPEKALILPPCPEVAEGGPYGFAFLRDGAAIDLGGRTLTAIAVPGHTPGSICLYDDKTRMLISGDAILKRVLYTAGVPFSAYRAGLEKAKRFHPRDILCAHWPDPLGAAHIDRMLALLDDFDPVRAEPAAWGVFKASDLRMFCHGREFEEPEFTAITFDMAQLDLLEK